MIEGAVVPLGLTHFQYTVARPQCSPHYYRYRIHEHLHFVPGEILTHYPHTFQGKQYKVGKPPIRIALTRSQLRVLISFFCSITRPSPKACVVDASYEQKPQTALQTRTISHPKSFPFSGGVAADSFHAPFPHANAHPLLVRAKKKYRNDPIVYNTAKYGTFFGLPGRPPLIIIPEVSTHSYSCPVLQDRNLWV